MTPFLVGPTGRPLLLDNADFLTTSPTSRPRTPVRALPGAPAAGGDGASPAPPAGTPDSVLAPGGEANASTA